MFSNFDDNGSNNMSLNFKISSNPFNLKQISILTNGDILIEDLIDKFLKKINIIFNSTKLEYIYNSKPLNKNHSVIEESLTNCSIILVIFK